MKNRDKLLIVLTILAMVLTVVIGYSYAYFTATVTGNDTAKSTIVEAGTMSLKLNGTQIATLSNAYPGSTHTINFSVENTGDLTASYSLEMINVTNTFVDRNDLVYSITSTNNGGSKDETIAPNANDYLINAVSIEPEEIQEYTLTLHFKETGENQNDNQNVLFTGKVQVNPIVLKLPAEYQQLEYIESSGTQYIDTQYIPTSNTKVDIEFMYSAAKTNYEGLFGSRSKMSAIDSYTLLIMNKNIVSRYSNVNFDKANVIELNTNTNLNYSKEGIYVNNSKIGVTSTNSFTGTYNMYLMANNTGGAIDYTTFKGKVYYFKIYESNVLKKYLIPAKRVSDNVIGMYDLINNEFYLNFGTGTFIAGPNV